jgi:hypothetical protein
VEYRIGHAVRVFLVEPGIATDFVAEKNDVAQHGEEMLLDTLDHFVVDKGATRRPDDVELEATRTIDHVNVEGGVAIEQFLAIIELVAAIEHGQRTIAEKLMQTAVTAIEKTGDFRPGQNFQTAGRRYLDIDYFMGHGSGFALSWRGKTIPEGGPSRAIKHTRNAHASRLAAICPETTAVTAKNAAANAEVVDQSPSTLA